MKKNLYMSPFSRGKVILMELTIQARESKSKGELNRIRRAGNIPAVVYNKGEENKSVTISGVEFQAHLRAIEKGTLATQFFTIIDGSEKYKVLLKDITYCRTKYTIQHMDLMKVSDADDVTIHIPVKCKGEDECVGIVEGGQLKKVKRSVKVSLKVKDIPKAFVLDVAKIKLGEALRVRDLDVKEGMTVRLQQSLVLVSVSK